MFPDETPVLLFDNNIKLAVNTILLGLRRRRYLACVLYTLSTAASDQSESVPLQDAWGSGPFNN